MDAPTGQKSPSAPDETMFSLKREEDSKDDEGKIVPGLRTLADGFLAKLADKPLTPEELAIGSDAIKEMVDYMMPYLDMVKDGKRYLPEEIFGKGWSTIFKNGSYGRTMENTLICMRTLAYNDFVNAVQEKVGRPLTPTESFLASQMLYDIATDPQCLYCYVALDRKAYNGFLKTYIEQRDAVLDKYKADDTIDKSYRLPAQEKSRKNRKGLPADNKVNKLYLEYLDGRADTPSMRNRFNGWLDRIAEGNLIGMKDLTSPETRQKVAAKGASYASQIDDAEKYAQSASWAKKQEEYRAYNGELLSMPQKVVDLLNSEYGLRFYSFSEYSPAFIVENMQMVRDAALRNLVGLAYTKEIDFAKIFAPTGININISCYGREAEDGTVVMDTKQGADWGEAQALRERYGNVGCVFVATNDRMVEWALHQPWIDVIIPFHIVRTGEDIAKFYDWTNYTSMEADKDVKGRSRDIMPTEHMNDKDTFLRLCEERGLKPRFADLILPSTGRSVTEDPNYMKLVNETRRSVNETVRIKPIFDTQEARRSFDEFVEKGGYYAGWFTEEGAFERGVEQVAADVEAGKTAKDVDYGRQDIKASAEKLAAMAGKKKRPRSHQGTPRRIGGDKITKTQQNVLNYLETGEFKSEREPLEVANATQKQPISDAVQPVVTEEDVMDVAMFRLSKNNKATVESWLKKREDINDEQRAEVVDYIDKLDDAKTQLATAKWFANGTIRIPEDMKKVQQAISVAGKAKVDPLRYKSPMELLDAHAEFKPSEERINPDEVSTLHRAAEYPEGIVVYDVDDTEESRKNMRDIINSHFGEDASPWCLLQGDGKGKLTADSKRYWRHYNAYPKQVAFKDGKLLAFSANDTHTRVWWDRQDEMHYGIPVTKKVEGDALGRSGNYILSENPAVTDTPGEFTLEVGSHLFKGNRQNGLYEEWNAAGDRILERTNYKNGKEEGLSEVWYPNNGQMERRCTYKDGNYVGTYEAWFDNGRPRIYTELDDEGMNNGVKRVWNREGVLQSEGTYDHGKRVGDFSQWDDDGNLLSVMRYDADGDLTVIEEHDEFGIRQRRTYFGEDGQVLERFSRRGQLLSVERTEGGKLNGLQEQYYLDGTPDSRVEYTNGERNGLFEKYHPNGQLWIRGQFKDGKKDGVHESWSRDGVLNTRTVFKDDEVVEGSSLDALRFRKAFDSANEELGGERVSVDNPDLMREYGLSNVTMTKKGDLVTLNKVVVADQKKGNGTRFMNDLTSEADNNGWTLALTPDDSFGATSVGRLKKFYKRFGFKDNKGRNADLTVNESMIRQPEAPRFRLSNREEMDREYMAAVEAGDMDTAQRMVDEAAVAAGFTTRGYHQTNSKRYVNKETGQDWDTLDWNEREEWEKRDDWDEHWEERDFYTFDRRNARTSIEMPAFFFAPEEDPYHEYGDRTIDAYLKLTNPVINPEIENAGVTNDAGEVAMRKYIAEGYDGFIREEDGQAYEYGVFDASQIKSAEPVTYDDEGNVVPLSKRFDLGNDDIRFRKVQPIVDESNEELFDFAKKRFGTTRKLSEAGYVLPDGAMLDFSGRHLLGKGQDGSWLNDQRTIDHREIQDLNYLEDLNTPSGIETDMSDFIRRGAIRLNTRVINLATKPTKGQENVLWTLISRANGNVDVDFGDGYDSDHYASYDNARPERILNDIRRYFDEGVNPEGNVMFRKANQTQNGFISNAEAALDRIKMDKATPEQWMKMLEKEGGLKAGEDKWLGLSDWLKESDKKTITKDEIGDFIEENRIQIEEVRYGGSLKDEIRDTIGRGRSLDELQDEIDEIRESEEYKGIAGDNIDAGILTETMVDRYGDDFEMGYTIDEQGRIDYQIDPYADEEFRANQVGDTRPIHYLRMDYTTAGLENNREIALTVPTIEPWNESDEIHFGDAGEGRAVAWTRFGDASDAEGNKVLVIDEIQSKRHQEGREKGYKTTFEEREKAVFEKFPEFKEVAEGHEKAANIIRKIESDTGRPATGLFQEDFEKYKSQIDEYNRLENAYHLYMNNHGKELQDYADSLDGRIPKAPFEKNWHELAMKRMLRLAAEEGYDKVAWTTGDQQAERYNIGGVLNSIERRDSYNLGEKEFTLNLNASGTQYITTDEEGNIINTIVEDYRGKTLSDLVGKELAIRMLSMKEGDTIQGDGFRVGGEGMKGFYDDILPRFMNKYGKKWGVKVGTVELQHVYDELGHPLVMHSVDVTPEMRESVMEGQVMFRKTAPNGKPSNLTDEQWETVRTPEFKAWFGDWEKGPENSSKVVDENGEPLVVYHGGSFGRPTEEEWNPYVWESQDANGWFAQNKSYAQYYIHEYGQEPIGVFLNIRNPFAMGDTMQWLVDEGKPTRVAEDYAQRLGITVDEILRLIQDEYADDVEEQGRRIINAKAFTINRNPEFSKLLVSKGYDGAMDIEADGSIGYMVTQPNQIKLADATTYNDNGEEIPISERFNPNNDDIRFSLRGIIGAENAEDEAALDNLEVAEDMEKAGKDSQTIWKATGWERGADGKWRNEIPDARQKEGVSLGKTNVAGEVIDAPELFASYPDLKAITIELIKSKSAGAFNEGEKRITLDKDYNTRKEDGRTVLNENGNQTVLHELQHAIQEIEGFARGGNKKQMERQFYKDSMKAQPDETLFAWLVSRFQGSRMIMLMGRRRIIDAMEKYDDSKLNLSEKKTFRNILDRLMGMDETQFKSFVLDASQIAKKAKEAGDVGYNNLAGEVEARNVERRSRILPEKDRKNYPPEITEDVLRSEQVIRFRKRTKEDPKETIKVYKLMRLEDGKKLPLFIDRNSEPLEDGQWYDADSPDLAFLKEMPSGIFLVDADNGTYTSLKDYQKERGAKATKWPTIEDVNEASSKGLRWMKITDTEKGQKRYEGENRKYENIGINGSDGVSTFAMRPGWHAGSLPTMRQIGKGAEKNIRDDNFVWVEGEIPADIDYNEEAQRNPDKDIPTHIPTDGFYMKATNVDKAKSQADRVGWYVAGAFKPNRVIGDLEARQIIDDWNAEHPDANVEYDWPREGGRVFNAETMRLEEPETEETIRFRKSQDMVKQSRESGLAGVIGDEDASELYRDIYRAVPSDIRQMIVDKAGDGYIFTDATRDMISEAVEKGDETGIAGLAANMLRNYVGDLDERTARYVLWRGTRRAADDDIIDTVNDIAIQRRLQVGEFADPVMFRLSDDVEEAQTRADSMADDAKAELDEKKADARENDALTTIKAMSLQKEYDRKTVNTISVLAKNIIKDQSIDTLNRREIARLLGIITTSVGKAPKTVKKNADALMGLVVDHLLRSEETKLGMLTSRKASKVNAAGVEVQGELDVRGQNILKAYKVGLDMEIDNPNDETDENTINGRLAILSERLSGNDDALRSEAEDEFAGLMLAKEYLENIKANVNEERGIRNEIKAAEEDLHVGKMSRKDFNEFIEEANNSIRKNKVERIEAYRDLAAKMRDMMAGSIEARKAFTEREKARVEEIHHLANSDMQGRTASPFRESTRLGRLANSSIVRFFAKPLATFDQMLRLFGEKNVAGEGYLWNKFHRGWIEANENAYLGEREAKSELDAKVSEVFGKEMRWSDLYAEERKMPTVPVKWWDDGEMREHELTQGNLLYIYMVNKMTDGRMKLRRMGITQDIVDRIARQMDSRFIELADWLQSEYLVQKRNKYNAVHERLFGASMAAIEDYFPLKINKRSLNRAEDIGRPEFDDALPATTTGSIIKRRRNAQDLDLLGADAFSVVIEHVEQMEQWAAFAEFNKDLNTLLSYKRFRNQVQNMASVYGSGRELWNNFKSVCRIAGGTYSPAGKKSDLDTAALNIAKGVTAAKISFRVYTALKQFLSMPAFVADASPKYLAANMATPWKAWNWAMENLPMFEKRWKSRQAGDTRLMKTESDWKLWRNQIVEKASQMGMSPNAFVDALTVSIGSHSIYQSRYDRYIKDGYTEEQADKKAKQDATTLYNETQQSNEAAFVAPVQLDRTVLSTMLTVFRNSSMGYQRQLHDAIRNIGKMLRPKYKSESVEFMKLQMIRDGLTEEQAEHAAERNYNREIWRSAARVATFGFLVQFAWNLGGSIAYLLFGDDDDKKEEMLTEAALHGLIGGTMEGLAGGNVMSEAINMVAKGESLSNYDPSLLPIVSDLKSAYKKMSYDPVAGSNDLINLAIQAGIGVNPQTLTDAVVAVVDACGGDLDTSKEAMLLIMRVLQVPQSQVDQIYIDELGTNAAGARKMSPGEMAERYARYKVAKGAPLTGWAYSDEAEEKREKAYLKRFKKLVKERKESER